MKKTSKSLTGLGAVVSENCVRPIYFASKWSKNVACILKFWKSRDEDPTFFSTDPAQLETYSGSGPDSGSDLKSKWRKKYIGIKFDIINHHFLLAFVVSGLYIINNFIIPLLQVGSSEKSIGSGSSPLEKKDTYFWRKIYICAIRKFTQGWYEYLLKY